MTNSIERELRDMTEWKGQTPELWRRALDQSKSDAVPERTVWTREFHVCPWMGLAAAGVLLMLIVPFLVLPSLSTARSASPDRAPSTFSLEGRLVDGVVGSDYVSGIAQQRKSTELGQLDQAPVDGRSVVRKATIELEVEALHTAIAKIRPLLSEARAEYIETSDVDATATHPRATIVLRVDAARLETVLSDLRTLGEVKSERLDAEDVTDQVIDIRARLTNEQRIEQELLQLLDSRPDDDLDDILTVRRELGAVRERIERLTAQQQSLARLVALARISVILTTPRETTSDPEPAGLWSRFSNDIDGAWRDGVGALLSTIAWLTRVLIGGAPWFLIAGAAIILARRQWRVGHPRPLPA
jgi:hypothetical protein